jgi:hypothetical protein
LHWRINNSELLSHLFDYHELAKRSVEIPDLTPGARGLCSVDALLFACFHRYTHLHNPYQIDDRSYFGGDRLIWLYDIHLLAGKFNAMEWKDLEATASRKGLSRICLQSLKLSCQLFGTRLPAEVMERMHNADGLSPIDRYLQASNLR